MFEFLDNLAPENEEQISETRVNNIKASVLSRIEEEKPMKKHFSIKPFVIAAAIMTTGAVSVLGASAATKNTSDRTVPVTITYQQTDSAELPENTPTGSYTLEVLGELGTENLTEVEVSLEYNETDDSITVEQKRIEIKELIDEADGYIYEVDGQMMKVVGGKFSDMELIGIDEDGTHHYKSRYVGTTSRWTADGNYDDDSWSSFIYVRVD